MPKPKQRILRTLGIAALVVTLPTTAIAFPIDLLRKLTPAFSKITQIDQDFLNAGLDNYQDIQSVFRNGDVKTAAGNILGRLGVPDSAINTAQSLENGDYKAAAMEVSRIARVEEHVHRVLGGQGQEEQGRELGQAVAYGQATKEQLEAAEQIAQDAQQKAQSAQSEAKLAAVAGQTSQKCNSSQCSIKALARQLSNLSYQFADGSSQQAALTTNLSHQTGVLAAMAQQQAIGIRQNARDATIQAFQLDTLASVNSALLELNQRQIKDRITQTATFERNNRLEVPHVHPED